MKKEYIDVEYSILKFIELPEYLKIDDDVYSVTVSIFEIDKQSHPISMIGTFNFKVPTRKDKTVRKLILKRLNEIVLFKSKNQKKINKNFEKIVSGFNKIDSD